jgi:TonB family protein
MVRPVTHILPEPVEGARTPRHAVMRATVGLDAGAVRSYRIALARLLAGGALRTGLTGEMQGTLEVGVAVTANGLPQQVELVRSSGQTALDVQVLAAVRAAAHEAAIPELMRGQAFVVVLPVEVGPLVATTSTATSSPTSAAAQ